MKKNYFVIKNRIIQKKFKFKNKYRKNHKGFEFHKNENNAPHRLRLPELYRLYNKWPSWKLIISNSY